MSLEPKWLRMMILVMIMWMIIRMMMITMILRIITVEVLPGTRYQRQLMRIVATRHGLEETLLRMQMMIMRMMMVILTEMMIMIMRMMMKKTMMPMSLCALLITFFK